jgi:hypothetical protein
MGNALGLKYEPLHIKTFLIIPLKASIFEKFPSLYK